MTVPTPAEKTLTTHFIRHIIEADLQQDKFVNRKWHGAPALEVTTDQPDPAAIRTRFPPEPNGYLHFGHAKSICLNFGLAEDYGGACHLRFDDTNPEKEEDEYVQSIIEAVAWLGFKWTFEHNGHSENNIYYASDYFEWMLTCAKRLIHAGLAYVDSQDPETIRQQRGTLTEHGRNSPYRGRSVAENTTLFADMIAGKYPNGQHVLRAKIDMASPNINLRDPPIYRIRHASHHRTGDRYCVYPMYTFAHPIEDALENITHSLCTLEFEDQRPFYDWLLEHLADLGCFQRPLPQQTEFSRLNLSYVVLSKRRLAQLVNEGHVSGWDDPRMPTLIAARRRGYPAAGFRLFAQRLGVSKSDSLIDFGVFEDCMRTVLNEQAPRRMAVLDPIRLVITNYPEDASEFCMAANHPQQPELGKREVEFSRSLWIERDDFMEIPAKGYHRLSPGQKVRLRYAYVVTCLSYDKDESGRVHTVYCEYHPETRSGSAGADLIKVKGNIHWVSKRTAVSARVRLYDRLFLTPLPGSNQTEADFTADLNPDSCRECIAQIESSLQDAAPSACYQFERHGYFAVDSSDSQPQQPVFNRTVTLRDTWSTR